MRTKKFNSLNRIILIINILFSILLLFSCAISYISAKTFPVLIFLSLGVPILVVGNILFFIYWIFRRNKYFVLSFGVLIFGYFLLGTFFKFKLKESPISENDLSVMSFNVKGFKKYGNIINFKKNVRINENIVNLIAEQDPDIVCFQDFDFRQAKRFGQYPFSYVNTNFDENKVQQAIFSKYPMISMGDLDFPESSNNAIYVDVIYQLDTLRIYNIHLQSFRVVPRYKFFENEPSEKLFKRVEKTFVKQQQQAKMVNDHRKTSPYKTIVCGDFNTTQFSNAYRVIKADMKDSFLEMGVGFGRTYNLIQLPYRIDFILADPSFEVTAHKNFDVQLSDHFPVMATFR